MIRKETCGSSETDVYKFSFQHRITCDVLDRWFLNKTGIYRHQEMSKNKGSSTPPIDWKIFPIDRKIKRIQ